jgi:hypothetical protein
VSMVRIYLFGSPIRAVRLCIAAWGRTARRASDQFV